MRRKVTWRSIPSGVVRSTSSEPPPTILPNAATPDEWDGRIVNRLMRPMNEGLKVLGTLNHYPDPSNARLRKALSDRYGVPTARIAIGNGSVEILMAAGEVLLEPGAELVYAWPSFSVYPHLSAASGATEIRVPVDAPASSRLSSRASFRSVKTPKSMTCSSQSSSRSGAPYS